LEQSQGSGDLGFASTTLEDAQPLLPGTEAVTGEPHEIVKYDLSN
jgi:hypothetical protein